LESWNRRGKRVRVRLTNFVSWNPGIERKKDQGQAVELRVLESWNRRGKRVRVRLSNFVSWNPGI
jgi:hypothetical protein